MVEIIVKNYLTGKLEVPVQLERLPPSAARYVLVEKTGSARENRIDRATIAIQSYAESLYQAALLNDAVKLAMLDAVELDSISSCRLVSDYNYTDQESKQYRYQAVYELVYFD